MATLPQKKTSKRKKSRGQPGGTNYAPNLNPVAVRYRFRKDPRPKYLGVFSSTYGPSTEYTAFEPYREECRDRRNPGPPYRQGSPLLLNWTGIEYEYSPNARAAGFVGRRYHGKMIPRVWTSITDPDVLGMNIPLTSAQLDVLGSDAWARFKPGNPDVQSGQFIYELGRVPSIDIFIAAGRHLLGMKNNLRRLVNLGNRYLDVEFGWKPFLSDLRSLYQIQKTMHSRLEQLARDNGRRVRRRGVLRSTSTPISSSTQQLSALLYPPLVGEMYNPLVGTRVSENHLEQKIWFSAGFRYHIPDLGTPQWTDRATRALFGANVNPSTIWEVMPWSWLIDWFSNVGAVLSNLSENAAENLAADYAFIMVETKNVATHRETQGLNWFGSSTLYSAKATSSWITKQRQAASPFNFGVIPADLSVRQALILAALGISRRW